MPNKDKWLMMVLRDGETMEPLTGSMIVEIPSELDPEDLEDYLKNNPQAVRQTFLAEYTPSTGHTILTRTYNS